MTENERAQHSAAHRRRSRAVSAQYALFEKELPALLEAHAGEWVVYLDGPKHFAADQDSALRWACGLTWETPFVVAEVAPIVARPLSAAHAFQPVASVSTDEALRAQVAAARAEAREGDALHALYQVRTAANGELWLRVYFDREGLLAVRAAAGPSKGYAAERQESTAVMEILTEMLEKLDDVVVEMRRHDAGCPRCVDRDWLGYDELCKPCREAEEAEDRHLAQHVVPERLAEFARVEASIADERVP